MGIFFVGLSAVLGVLITKLVPRILTSLGIGIAVYTGLQPLLDTIFANLQSSLSGLPSYLVYSLILLQADVYFNMVASATVAKLSIGAAMRLVKR